MATANDKLQDESIAHAIWVSRYSTGVANRMIKVLNDSDAELTARLLVAIDTLDPESFTVSRLEALLVSVRAINKDAIQSMYAALSTELQELAKHEASFQMSLFQFAIPDDVLWSSFFGHADQMVGLCTGGQLGGRAGQRFVLCG